MKIKREYCRHRDDKNKKVELFWSMPQQREDKSPLILLVHGHNEGLRYGGRTDLFTGLFEYFSDNGFITISISQPGYGGSSGPADYCGPFTQRAVSSVLDYFEGNEHIDWSRIILYGLSRGATVVGMVSTFDSRVNFVCMVAGLYNLRDGFEKLNDGIKESIQIESNKNIKDLCLRSPLLNIKKIKIPTLIIHGEKDTVAPFEYAKEFLNEGTMLNHNIKAHFFENYEHGIPFSICGELVLDFLKMHGAYSSTKIFPYLLGFK